jgi:hypothetical protein
MSPTMAFASDRSNVIKRNHTENERRRRRCLGETGGRVIANDVRSGARINGD